MSEQHAQVISIAEQRAARDARQGAELDDARSRCAATTVEGRRCRNYAVAGDRCGVHARREHPARGSVPPRRDPGLYSGSGRSGAATASRTQPSADDSGREAATAAGGTKSSELPPRDPDAFAWAQRELARRGFGRAVDGLALLRELADDRFAEVARAGAELLRRRLSGDYTVDEFGFDEDLTTSVLLPLLRPLHRYYWRISSHGVEHLPAEGPGLLVVNHAGTLPVDAVMTRLDVYDATGRHVRELAADLVFRTPVVGPLARKGGATLASGGDADRLLAVGELVGVWPEGYKGLGKPWRDRYKLQRFGRGGFVATALRAGAPIVPTAVVGSEEIYPLLFDLRALARLFGLPYFPVVAQALALPVVGPFALLPLPSKWIIEYGEPIQTTAYPPEISDDPMAVFDLTDQVRGRIQAMLHANLMGRRSVFL